MPIVFTMKKLLGICVISFGIVTLCAGVLTPSYAASERCIGDWTKAMQVVRKEKLAKVDHLSEAAMRAGLGFVVKARLCRRGDDYIYRVILRDPSGRLTRQVTGARRPFGTRSQVRRAKPNPRRKRTPLHLQGSTFSLPTAARSGRNR